MEEVDEVEEAVEVEVVVEVEVADLLAELLQGALIVSFNTVQMVFEVRYCSLVSLSLPLTTSTPVLAGLRALDCTAFVGL